MNGCVMWMLLLVMIGLAALIYQTWPAPITRMIR